MNILVTGGLGFIGSHTIVKLINEKHKVYIIDNLVNSSLSVLDKLKQLVKYPENIIFKKLCLLQNDELNRYLHNLTIDSCIHFASLKSVRESISNPLLYYNNNINGLLNLLQALKKINCNKIIFSSSATVYGNNNLPFYRKSTNRN